MNKKSLIKKIIILLIPIYIIFGLGYFPSFIAKIMHFKYLFSYPDDYFTNLVDDKTFDFYTKGYSKTYKLDYKYFTLYSIDMEDENKRLPEEENGELYKFKGKIKVEFFSKNRLIQTDYILKWLTGGFSNDIRYLEYYELKNFTIPVANQYKDLSIKLTVIKPIKYNPENKLKLVIGATLKE